MVLPGRGDPVRMNPEVLKELKEAVATATPGEWRQGASVFSTHVNSADKQLGICDTHTTMGDVTLRSVHDARFIALANPSTISALMERVEELEEAVDDATRHLGNIAENIESYCGWFRSSGSANVRAIRLTQRDLRDLRGTFQREQQ